MKCERHKTNGEPCRSWAIKGANVCRVHGGAAGQVKRKAAARRAEQAARAAIGKLTITPVENPLTALSEVAGEIVAMKDVLRGQTERLEQIRYSGMGSEQIRGELQAYQAALRDTVHALSTIAKLNIDERLVRIEEQQAALVIKAIEAALVHAEVAAEKRAEAKKVAIRHLRVA